MNHPTPSDLHEEAVGPVEAPIAHIEARDPGSNLRLAVQGCRSDRPPLASVRLLRDSPDPRLTCHPQAASQDQDHQWEAIEHARRVKGARNRRTARLRRRATFPFNRSMKTQSEASPAALRQEARLAPSQRMLGPTRKPPLRPSTR
jgi:hypothetical protein